MTATCPYCRSEQSHFVIEMAREIDALKLELQSKHAENERLQEQYDHLKHRRAAQEATK